MRQMQVWSNQRREIQDTHSDQENGTPGEEEQNDQARLISFSDGHCLPPLSTQRRLVLPKYETRRPIASVHWQSYVVFRQRLRSGMRACYIIQFSELAPLVERIIFAEAM